MKIKFLGTGGAYGVPVWNCNCKTCTSKNPKNVRFRPSILIEIDDKNIVIDFGQDFWQQLVKNKVKKLDYALLTHAHGDHRNGMEQLKFQNNIQIMIPEKVLTELTAKTDSLKGIANRNLTIKVENFTPFYVGDFRVDCVELEHKKKYDEKGMSVYGYVFKSDNFSFAYLTDYNRIIDEFKVENLDLIISDACTWEDEGIGHLGIKGAIDVYKKLKPKYMILTHLNHTVEHEEAEKYVKEFGNIDIAFDGMNLDYNL